MKTKLVSLITILPLVTAAHGAVLIGGFHDGDALAADGTGSNMTGNVQLQSATLTGVTATLALTTADAGLNFTNSHYGQIYNGTWGSTSLDVNPPGDNLNKSILQSTSAYTLTLTLTNGGTSDLLLDKIHYSIKSNAGADAPATLAYLSGGGLGASGVSNSVPFSNGAGATPFNTDYAIGAGGFGLTDTILAVGESATFTWSKGDTTGYDVRFDNFAISGAVVPEPSSAALIGLAGLAFIARRRRN